MILRISLMLIVAGIAYLSLTPSETITIGNDKIGHFIAYSVLMLNIGLIWFPKKKQFIIGIVSALVYGLFIEIGQNYTPGRVMSGYDMLANSAGVLLGVLITVFFHKWIIKILKTTRII